MISDHSHYGHTGSRGGLLGRLARTGELVHFTYKVCYYHAMRFSWQDTSGRIFSLGFVL